MSHIKVQVFNEETGQYEFVDERNFAFCVNYQLKTIRETAKEKILAAAPEHKQRNAALGLLDPVETQALKDAIQAIRAQSNLYESQINAVVWDGQESTRAAACNAVQAVRWQD